MIRNGRPAIPDFDPREALYLRYGADEFLEGQLDPAAIRFPKQSVNRAGLSEPQDVLIHECGKYNGLGVVCFCVEDIPPAVTGEQGSSFRFFMHHEPFEDNYSHSEIWSARIDGNGEYREPSKSAKLTFRIELAKKIIEANIRIPAARNKG